ncbi:radical SAM protein, partial [bacterium]|nr:radical SAM protein [candidate division CSSED10-310 bacterium]
LGQDVDAPILHPAVISGFGTRIMGIPIYNGHTAAVLIPSVGCPVGCNFCSTSTLFGGKGHSVNFYETGDELFSILTNLEQKLGVSSFFVLDENFLLYKQRAVRLLELMELHQKSWSFYIFSSARVLQSYAMEQLIRLGISWVWLGLEGKDSKYSKLNGVDTVALVKRFQTHGIRVLGSTIIGMEEHTPENIDEAVDYAVQHHTDFHQFMLYTPMPGTPLYKEHVLNNKLLSEEECPIADVHGQERFNFKHQHIRDGQENTYLLNAFKRDFEINGPSLARIVNTTLQGWKRYRHHPDKRIVKRFKTEAKGFSTGYAGAIWAMTRWYRHDPRMQKRTKSILKNMYNEFGWITRLLAPIIGKFLLITMKREEKRIARGWTYEPPVIFEKNKRALLTEKEGFAIPCLKIRTIKLPVYDSDKVLRYYNDRVEQAAAQIKEIRNNAILELTKISETFSCRKELARKQLSNIAVTLTEKRNQTGEQVLNMLEKFRDQCECDIEDIYLVFERMVQKCEPVRDEIMHLKLYMETKYFNAKKQIQQISRKIELLPRESVLS